MATIEINRGYSPQHTVDADKWEVTDGFVTFYKSTGGGFYKQVLAFRQEKVVLVERREN